MQFRRQLAAWYGIAATGDQLGLNRMEAMADNDLGSRHLRIGTEHKNGLICCSIADNGPGINDAVLERVKAGWGRRIRPHAALSSTSACRLPKDYSDDQRA